VNDALTVRRPWIVGLTGGIGSGKSTVAAAFVALGAYVVDADAVSHELTAPNGAALGAISAAFDGVVTDGSLNRAALRERVFADADARKTLEAILHPMIRVATEAALASDTALAAPYVILMVPLLFESGTYKKRINCAVVVDVDEETQIERVARTRGLSPEEIRRIITTQMPRRERLAHAQFVIDNRGNAEALKAQITVLHSVFVVNASNAVRSLIAPTAEAI
jgi:dephospho-CoA kinase